ncbi:MAG: hypothetical protein JOY61_25675 [Chloroflexi bacterium]|nr:hypothetical protein [Chloroflexota bacterium]
MKPLHVFGLELTAVPSALATYVALVGVGALVAKKRRQLPLPATLVAGLAVAALHASSVLFHHFGHALFARWTGHPMTGVRFWGGLATSVYPSDEPPLPATVHLTRAAGGPLASLLLGIILAAVTCSAARRSQVVSDLTLLGAFDNLFVLALGSLMPLSFTDGATLIQWSRRTP